MLVQSRATRFTSFISKPLHSLAFLFFNAPQSAAAASMFGAFGAAASSPATGSPFGQPATPAAPFGTPAKPAGSVFGAPATPGFGQAPSGEHSRCC